MIVRSRTVGSLQRTGVLNAHGVACTSEAQIRSACKRDESPDNTAQAAEHTERTFRRCLEGQTRTQVSKY